MLAPPGGDAYSFLLNLISYPLNIFNTLISFALMMVYFNKEKYQWSSPVTASLPVVVSVSFIVLEPGDEEIDAFPFYSTSSDLLLPRQPLPRRRSDRPSCCWKQSIRVLAVLFTRGCRFRPHRARRGLVARLGEDPPSTREVQARQDGGYGRRWNVETGVYEAPRGIDICLLESGVVVRSRRGFVALFVCLPFLRTI